VPGVALSGTSASSHPTVAVDCRWLLFGGAGRATQLLLRGLPAVANGDLRWRLWGPPEVREWAWPEAEVVEDARDPRAMRSQRAWWSVPTADLLLFLHQRPLRPVPSVTVIYDTIPVRHAPTWAGRRSRQVFLRASASLSRHVVTPSEFSRRCLERDLGLARSRVSVIPLPADEVFARRVLGRAAELGPDCEAALYVGRFASHKNLARLVSAFGRTRFRRRGGRLILVGGTEAELASLLGRPLDEDERAFLDVRRGCSDDELETLYATCRLLVQPSLEEGFGLPAWEALSCGLPVAASDGGSLPEIVADWAEPFSCRSESAMAEAIDRAADRAEDSGMERRRQRADAFLGSSPSVADYASSMQAIVAGQLR